MNRTILLFAAMLVAVPAAFAHDPPGRVTTCQLGGGAYHDYLTPSVGSIGYADGNTEDCVDRSIVLSDLACAVLARYNVPRSPPCGASGIDRPGYDADGEPDYGYGGAILLAEEGDGATHGVVACHGPPATAHHPAGGAVYALDVQGFGPRFRVLADGASDDCGNGFITPCAEPPAPSGHPYPANVAEDEVNMMLWAVFNEDCDPLDHAIDFASAAGGPSGGVVPFAPGADGAYLVFIMPDAAAGRVPVAGHIWS